MTHIRGHVGTDSKLMPSVDMEEMRSCGPSEDLFDPPALHTAIVSYMSFCSLAPHLFLRLVFKCFSSLRRTVPY